LNESELLAIINCCTCILIVTKHFKYKYVLSTSFSINVITQKNKIQAWATISLLAVYLLISFLFILTLPQLNRVDFKSQALSSVNAFSKNSNRGATGNNAHRCIRTTIETRQKLVIPATTISILFFAFLFGKFKLLDHTKPYIAYISSFYVTQIHTYLSLRTFLI